MTAPARPPASPPEIADTVLQTFRSFDIEMKLADVRDGLAAVHLQLEPVTSVRMRAIADFDDDLRFALGVKEVEIAAPIPGTSLIGITIRKQQSTPPFAWPVASSSTTFTASKHHLPIPFGRDDFGEDIVRDLAALPHLLIVGAAGTGKSTALHTLISSLVSRNDPDQLRLILIDTQHVELAAYNGIPHLLTPVINDAKKTILALKWLDKEMRRRLILCEQHDVSTIDAYHEHVLARPRDADAYTKARWDYSPPEAMPRIVIAIEDLAEVMAVYPREIDAGILALLTSAPRVGIHLVLSTSQPAAKIITPAIKHAAARMVFHMPTTQLSRSILGVIGAERLHSPGDALLLSKTMDIPLRLQTVSITETDVRNVVAEIKSRYPQDDDMDMQTLEREIGGFQRTNGPIFIDAADDDDELYPEAVAVVREAGKASTSYLQRKLGIGYARSARLMDLLEIHGVIGPADGAKPREVITGK